MKRLNCLIFIIAIVAVLSSCSGEVPNPIVGTYSLETNGTTAHSASIELKSDETFVFVQIIPGTSKTLKIEGTYTYVLNAFTFTAADGSIHLTAKNIPTEIKDSFIGNGTNYFLYSWKCDKNNGPQSLTLTTDPNNSAEIYEFIYAGGQTALDNVKTTYSNTEAE